MEYTNEEMKAASNEKNEEFEERKKGWKKTIEEIFSLMKELTGNTGGQKVEENCEEEHKEALQSQGSGMKVDEWERRTQYLCCPDTWNQEECGRITEEGGATLP